MLFLICKYLKIKQLQLQLFKNNNTAAGLNFEPANIQFI